MRQSGSRKPADGAPPGADVLTIRLRGGMAEIVAIRHGRQRDSEVPAELEH